MYNVSIEPKAQSEEEYAVIMSVLSGLLEQEVDTSKLNLVVRPINRSKIEVFPWGEISRQERFRNKF